MLGIWLWPNSKDIQQGELLNNTEIQFNF